MNSLREEIAEAIHDADNSHRYVVSQGGKPGHLHEFLADAVLARLREIGTEQLLSRDPQ